MATHHAKPGEIVDLQTWAADLPKEHTKAIVKTDEMELIRIVLPAGKGIPQPQSNWAGHYPMRSRKNSHYRNECHTRAKLQPANTPKSRRTTFTKSH